MTFPLTQQTSILTNLNTFQQDTLAVTSIATSISQSVGAVPAQQLLSLLVVANALSALMTSMLSNATSFNALMTYMTTLYPGLSGAAASFTATRTALNALITAVVADLPVDSQGFLQVETLVANVPTMTSFQTAQLTNTLPAITAFLATLD